MIPEIHKSIAHFSIFGKMGNHPEHMIPAGLGVYELNTIGIMRPWVLIYELRRV